VIVDLAVGRPYQAKGQSCAQAHSQAKAAAARGGTRVCAAAYWPTMSTRFWSSPAATWRLARFALMALGGFLALQWILDAWIATVVGVVVATFLLIEEVLSRRILARRAGITDQSSTASP